MRKASIRDLHINTSALVREAADGETIVIERRGEPVAELRPITPRPAPDVEARRRMFERVEAFWAGKPMMPNSTPWVEDDRDR